MEPGSAFELIKYISYLAGELCDVFVSILGEINPYDENLLYLVEQFR